MRLITPNGEPTISHLMLRQPIHNEWRARVTVTSPDIAEGDAVVIDDEHGNTWHGTAIGATIEGPHSTIDMVGGAGLLDAPIQERFVGGGVSVASLVSELCAEVGEVGDAVDGFGLFGQWRVRGGSLRGELSRIAAATSGAFRITPTGEISLLIASGEANPLGRFQDAIGSARVYPVEGIASLAGYIIDGWRVGVALWTYSPAERLSASLWRFLERSGASPPNIVSGTIKGATDARVDVATDGGSLLLDVPLFSAVGFAPVAAVGSRVVVVDLAGDPRSTVALSGAGEAMAESIAIGNGAEDITIGGSNTSVTISDGSSEMLPAGAQVGRALRYGDVIMFPVGPVGTPTPMPILGSPAGGPTSKVTL